MLLSIAVVGLIGISSCSVSKYQGSSITPSVDCGWAWFVKPGDNEHLAEQLYADEEYVESPAEASARAFAEEIYDAVGEFHEGMAAARRDGKWGYIDEFGTIRIDTIYAAAHNFSEGKAAVKRDVPGIPLGEWAYIDKSGNVVIDFRQYSAVGWGVFPEPGEFQGGYAIVPNDLYWIINDMGEYVFMGDSKFFIHTQEYNAAFDAIPAYVFADTAMTVKKYGFMRLDGSQKVEPVFEYVYGVNKDGLAIVEIGTDADGSMRKGIIRLK